MYESLLKAPEITTAFWKSLALKDKWPLLLHRNSLIPCVLSQSQCLHQGFFIFSEFLRPQSPSIYFEKKSPSLLALQVERNIQRLKLFWMSSHSNLWILDYTSNVKNKITVFFYIELKNVPLAFLFECQLEQNC